MDGGASTRVFVYGTLRYGEPNHRLLAGRAPVRVCRTAPGFTLVTLGAFPAMLAGGETAIVGEVYEVDADTLEALDALEGHPDFYRRGAVRLEDGEVVQAYVLNPDCYRGQPVIASGDWLEGRGSSKAAVGAWDGLDWPDG